MSHHFHPRFATLTLALATTASVSLVLTAQASAAVVAEDFSSPSKVSNAGISGFLGTGGADFDYNGNFGTWLYSNGNGGIDEAAEGDGSGSSNNNAISSVGLSRSQDERGTNARANWVIFNGSLFTNGTTYTVSFDVIGDASGNDAGRYWMAELSGYDNSGSNYIQGDGTHNGWATAKPFVAFGSASVNYIQDSASNGVLLDGENVAGTTQTSFEFTYDGTNSPDIGFAVGTFNNVFAIDNFTIEANVVPEPASLALIGFGGLLMTRRRRAV